MTALPRVEPDWLVLRADADDRSRSAELADLAASLLPPGEQVIHDLGSGSGAMMRWLAPRLPGPQRWVLHDADAEILAHAGPADTSVEPLEELTAEHLRGATLVVASALLDVITADEARAIVTACQELRVPALFSLSVIGRVELDPPDLTDQYLVSAFNEHQRRTVDDRRLLGPDAVDVLAGMLCGWRVHIVDTPWRLGSADRPLVEAWLDGWLAAAIEQRPALAELADDYRATRIAQLDAGTLQVVVHHRDALAWP